MKDFAYRLFLTNQYLGDVVVNGAEVDLQHAYLASLNFLGLPWERIHGCKELVGAMNKLTKDAIPNGDCYFRSDLDKASQVFVQDVLDFLHAAGAPVKRLQDIVGEKSDTNP
jgi:hypothetical protein